MLLVLSVGAMLGAMALVGLAFAGVPLPGVDGDAVVIAVATLFGAVVGGLTTFGVERWRLAEERRERQMIASMVVADSLLDFQIAVDEQVCAAEKWADPDEEMDKGDVTLPRFPLDDYRHWAASLPPAQASAMFALLRDRHDHNMGQPGMFILATWEGRPDPPDDDFAFARPIARFFFRADTIRHELDVYVGFSPRAAVCPERLDHLKRVAT